MKNTSILKKTALAAILALSTSADQSFAQNPNYAPGDLLLYFQQFGGTQTAMVNLGTAFSYRDRTTDNLNFINIGSTLTGSVVSGGAAFPANWYDDPTIFWGLAAVRSNSTSTSAQVDGDPGRTIYVSAPRTGVGTAGAAESQPWTFGSAGFMTTGANAVINMVNRMETIATTSIFVEPNSTSNVDLQNPFNIAGSTTTAFSSFPGGVMGSFNTGTFGTIGGVTAEGALDLYRILATTSPVGTVVEPGETALNGSYQGTFAIDQMGSVSYIVPVPEPATVGLLASAALVGLARRRRSIRA